MLDRRSSRRRFLFLALVAGLHLVLACLLLGALRQRPAEPMRQALHLVAVRLPIVQAPKPALRQRAAESPRAATPRTAAAASPATAEERVSTEVALMPDVAASAAPGAPAGLDPHATARALRESALNPTLAYRARVRDGRAPATLDERLEAGVKKAGRRDCLNGNVNPGAQGDSTLKYSPIPLGGILVAPFLVADAVLGKCGL